MNTSNQITIIGNIGEAPEVKTKTKSGKNVVSFAIAQNVNTISQSGERIPGNPQWFRVTCFGSLADRSVAHAHKGDLVLVSGELKSRSYSDKAGVKKSSFEIVAADVLKVERLRSVRDEKGQDAPASEPSFDEWDEERVSL